MAHLKDLIVSGVTRFIGKVYGTITNAIKDDKDQTISSTYIKNISGEGVNSLTITKGDGNSTSITVPNIASNVVRTSTNGSSWYFYEFTDNISENKTKYDIPYQSIIVQRMMTQTRRGYEIAWNWDRFTRCIWVRYCHDTWSDWTMIYSPDILNNTHSNRSVPESRDCNDCTLSGTYFFNGCNANAPTSDGSVSSGTYMLLDVATNTAAAKQMATFTHGAPAYLGKTYIRYLDMSTSTWSTWKQITTS